MMLLFDWKSAEEGEKEQFPKQGRPHRKGGLLPRHHRLNSASADLPTDEGRVHRIMALYDTACTTHSLLGIEKFRKTECNI